MICRKTDDSQYDVGSFIDVIIYLICFGVSVFFAWIAEKTRNRIVFYLFSVLSILVTVLLAGLRDVSIGIDTLNNYGNTWQVAVGARTTWHFLELFHRSFRAKEYLYAALIGFSANVFHDYHVFLTLVHLIIVGGVYIGAFRLRRYASPSLVLLFFYLFYYNHSLNVFRQYLAMAILFAGAADILERRYRRFTFILIIAILFHNTAVIGVLPLFIFQLLYPRNRLKAVSLPKRLLLSALIIVGAVLFVPFGSLLLKMGLLGQKYEFYLESEGTNTYLIPRALVLLELCGIIIYRRSWKKYKVFSGFFAYCTFAFGVLYQIAPSIPYGKRIPAYFSLINLVSLAILSQCQKNRNNRIIVRCITIAAALSYWLLMYAHYNTSRTIPYILGV